MMKLVTAELVCSIFDIFTPFFEASRIYRKSTRAYLRERQKERADFMTKIRYLRRQGYIESFVEGKREYLELTAKGRKYLQNTMLTAIKIPRPEKWDGKWRVLIFDVPERHRDRRDLFRQYIENIGFYPLQKSVYIYPFECTQEVIELARRSLMENYAKVMISDIIMGEGDIIEHFMNRGVLTEQDLILNK